MLESAALYMKAVVAAVGGAVFPPLVDWLVGMLPAPDAVHVALSTLLVAILMGGSVGFVANRPK